MTVRVASAMVWMMALLAMVLAVAITVKQTLHRPGTPFGDFSHLSTGAECLFDGCDPYDAAALNREAAAQQEMKPQVWAQAPVYPPSSLIVVMPFAQAGWPAGPMLFDSLSGLLYGIACAMLVWRLGIGFGPAAMMLLVGLVCSPIVSAFQFANPALMCTALAALACMMLLQGTDDRARWGWAAWVLLGLAIALKPQLVLGVALVLIWKPRTRRAALNALALSLALLIVGCVAYRLRLGSFQFLAQLEANVKLSLVPGSTSDFSRTNDDSFDFLNLQAGYSRIPHVGRGLADALAWITTLALAGMTWWAGRRADAQRRRPWTLVALAATIGVMPVYHRGYDRVIALLLVPAAVEIGRRSRRLAWAYALTVCWWVANDTVMSHVLRRFHSKAQNPVEELAICALLLGSLLIAADRGLIASGGDAAAFDAGEVREAGGRTHRRGAGEARRGDSGGSAVSPAVPV